MKVNIEKLLLAASISRSVCRQLLRELVSMAGALIADVGRLKKFAAFTLCGLLPSAFASVP